jgi:hypothetical protein
MNSFMMHRWLTAIVLAVLALGVSSCASEMKAAKADLAQIEAWYPGSYDNTEQAQEEARKGQVVHTAVALSVVRIDLPLFSEHAYYVQESVADDPRRVTSQRLVTFDVGKGGHILQSYWSLAQPGRWRDASQNPDLFKGMMYQDATRLGGCELEWKKEGEKYLASNQPAACRMNSPALGSVRMELRAELTADELALAELAYGASNKLVQGNPGQPFYRYRKRANP